MTAGTTDPGLSPSEGRPDAGAAAAYVGELFAAHGRMVLGLCRLLLRDPVEAEDAAQQTFVSAQRALLGGAAVREPAAWLAAIARNECRARIRARMREPLALPELPADIPDPLASAIRTADLDALWAALSSLPRRQRNAFLLRELGGLSYGELGTALGVTRPAIESLLFRARQQLRAALAAANTALLPLAVRDQLARFLPLGTPTDGAPLAAKVAAVTVGVGLGAAGAVELPKHHTHHPQSRSPAVAPQAAESHDAAPSQGLAATRSAVQPVRHRGGSEGARRDEQQAEAEPQPEREQQHQAAVPAGREDGHHGDAGQRSGDEGSGGSDSSSNGGDSSDQGD